MVNSTLHNGLMSWLVDLGTKCKDDRGNPYYKSYSGDSEPLDIRLGRCHFSYSPDVIWNRRGRMYLFEIAFNEDWRSIAGEIAIAGASGQVDGMLIITLNSVDTNNSKLRNVVSILSRKIVKQEIKYEIRLLPVIDETQAKHDILKTLIAMEWYWEK